MTAPKSLLCPVLLLLATGAAQAAPPSSHDHAAHAPAAARAVPAKAQWASDAPLREGMGRVRASLERLRHHEMGHMTPAMARDQAVEIEEAIAYVFGHCKLEQKADAALHGILVPLLDGARRLKKDPADLASIAAMREALAAYPRQFSPPY